MKVHMQRHLPGIIVNLEGPDSSHGLVSYWLCSVEQVITLF